MKRDIARKIDDLAENPYLGKPMGNKFGVNLTGFCKLYAGKKKYRIVYRILSGEIEIIEIIGIGKREKEEIYRLVANRLKGFRQSKWVGKQRKGPSRRASPSWRPCAWVAE